MRILIVAATAPEVEPLISAFKFTENGMVHGAGRFYTANSKLPSANLSLLVTGAGMVATAFALGRHLANNKYDLAINLGIAGSFNRNIPLGQVCEVTHDALAELGAEDDEAFISIDDLGFGESNFNATYALPEHKQVQKVSAITVNTVHGSLASIQKLSARIHAELESMEGAAFFYGCQQVGLPCLQIRTVSNYVEKRNRAAWQIGPAIKNLNTFAVEMLRELKVETL